MATTSARGGNWMQNRTISKGCTSSMTMLSSKKTNFNNLSSMKT
jgi:hypothetical protein